MRRNEFPTMNLTKPGVLLIPIAVGSLLIWAYWYMLTASVGKWSSAEYSHGYFVPVFAVALLWLRRNQIISEPCSPSPWGLLVLAAGSAVRVAASYYYVEYLEALSLLPCLVGLALCSGGKRALYWSWPSIAFLFFMLPFPYTLEVMLAGPLRRVAVIASTYTLQTFGFSAVAEGNIILMESQPILVAEACSGLSMLLTFFAMSTGVAMVTKRCLIDKAAIVLSALPIAIIANICRIVSTAILADSVGGSVAALVFHDLAGWLMMPLALGLLALELVIIDKLFVERQESGQSSLRFETIATPHAPAASSIPAKAAT
jgi:exosortase